MGKNKEMLLLLLKKDKDKLLAFAFYLLMLVCILGAFYYGISFQNVNDGFWHIKVGEYILKNKSVPHYDIFSWYGIQQHFKWTSHEWLFGILAYLVYSIHGFLGVSIFVSVINIITVLLVYTLAKTRSKNKWVSLLVAYGYCINSNIIITFRPILITIPLILIVCILLEKNKFVIALLVLILGINIHGGTYPVYIFIFGYYTLLKNYKVFLFSFIGIMINPYGYEIYTYTFKLLYDNGDANKYILEWNPTAIYNYKLCLAILFFSIFLCVFSKVRLKDLIFSAFIVTLSLTSVRQIIFMYSLLLPILSSYAVEAVDGFLITYLYNRKIYKNICSRIYIDKKKSFRVILAMLILITSVTSITLDSYDFIKNKSTVFKIYKDQCPVDAVDYILKHPEIKNSHLLSNYNDSQYLIFRGVPTFVDSREDLFTYNFNKTYVYNNYMSAFVDLTPTETLLRKYDIDYILLNVNSTIYKVLENKPMLLVQYEDPNYCILRVNKRLLKGED